MRAIDADKLKKCVLKWLPQDSCGKEEKEMPFETDICVSMLMEIDEQPTIHPEPHWIPVTERLPEEEGEYLVTSVYQYYRDGRKTYKTTVDRWSRNGAGKEWVATSNDAHIAWMPLPEPYKGVTNGN